MIQAKWIGSFAAALFCTGLACGQQSTALPPSYNKGDTITLQEPGKGETKVKVIKATRGADGKMTYDVEDVKTGDKATISDSPMAMSATPAIAEPAVPQKKGLLRFFSKPQRLSRKKETTPEMAPHHVHDAAKHSIENQLIPPTGDKREMPTGQLRPASGTMPKTKTTPKHPSMSKSDGHRSNANGNHAIQTVSFNDYAMNQPEMAPTGMDTGVVSYPMLGSPYWRVPAPMQDADAAGIARIIK
jgi:hypothetical protein